MPIFKTKEIEDADDEVTELESKIATMQDDVVEMIKEKNSADPSALKKAAKKGLRLKFGKNSKEDSRGRDISRDLADVYTDDDGQIPDLTKLDITSRPLWQTILYTMLAVFGGLFVVAAAAFFMYASWNQKSFTNERVIFKIVPPISVIAGQDQQYSIMIANNERVTLYNLNVILQYPENFSFVSSTIEAGGEKNNSWDISALSVGESKEIKFTARLDAAVNSVQTLSGTLTFKPENMNADFSQKTQVDLGVNSSAVIMSVDGPAKVMASDDVVYTINVLNTGADLIKNLEVAAEFPAGFVFVSSDPSPKEGLNNMWTIDKLATSTDGAATSSAKKIVIKGNYTGASASFDAIFKAHAVVRVSGGDKLLAENSLATTVVKDELSLITVINGSAENQPISFGDLLFYTLTYKNNGQTELKDVKITANMNSPLLDFDTLLDSNKGKVKDGTITWDKSLISKLVSLRPGEEGEISWQIRVKDLAALGGGVITQYSIENFATAAAKNADGGAVNVKSSILTASINSDLGLKAVARYYDDSNVAVGSGPIQPKAGETSSYNIALSLDNNLHNVGEIIVSLTLPAGVSWAQAENHNTGAVSFDAKTKKYSWTISKLPKSTAGTAADFNVTITPTEANVGKVLILVPEVRLVAKDLETGAMIDKSVKAITTSFVDPILGQVSGIVE